MNDLGSFPPIVVALAHHCPDLDTFLRLIAAVPSLTRRLPPIVSQLASHVSPAVVAALDEYAQPVTVCVDDGSGALVLSVPQAGQERLYEILTLRCSSWTCLTDNVPPITVKGQVWLVNAEVPLLAELRVGKVTVARIRRKRDRDD